MGAIKNEFENFSNDPLEELYYNSLTQEEKLKEVIEAAVKMQQIIKEHKTGLFNFTDLEDERLVYSTVEEFLKPAGYSIEQFLAMDFSKALE